MGLDVRHRFAAGRGYLGAATLGLPADVTVAALRRDVEAYATGTVDVMEYTALVERARGHAATLLGVVPSRVAVGSQASVFIGLAAAAAPPGAEVVCVEGDFASVVRPFLARGDLRVRQVPLAELAGCRGPGHVDGGLRAGVLEHRRARRRRRGLGGRAGDGRAGAGRRHPGDRAGCPRPDLEADLVVCHTYKWLCAPRGSAFAAFSERAQEEIRPLTAGWYSAADPWASCYGPELDLAPDASRYDVSPAWHAWVGAEAALGFAVSLDAAEVRDHAVGLANGFRERIGLGPSDSAIVSWPDPDGAHLAAFGAAGVAASGRAGRARVSFHLWNDEEDVDLAARALGR